MIILSLIKWASFFIVWLVLCVLLVLIHWHCPFKGLKIKVF